LVPGVDHGAFRLHDVQHLAEEGRAADLQRQATDRFPQASETGVEQRNDQGL
jgi:hypothetical protein